jgi:tRNA A-37 threonylcarbamoyl transferase component Bud32
MDPRYQLFSLADGTWYEPLALVDDHASRFSLATGQVPAGWRRGDDDVWVGLAPLGDDELPEQGWKIHLSATPAGAEETIRVAWDVCRELGLRWKFLRSRFLVTAAGSKYASRAASGKVVTIYPRDEAELENAVYRLDEALAGSEGPYILSDLRWRTGPVHLRYGAFRPMWCEGPDGGRVPAVRDDTGKLVPDVRRPAFTLPPWASRPDFLADHLPTAVPAEPMIGRYRVLRALHFSNAGGVYLAEDRDGTQVVLKEARPHAGLDRRETDATTRLRHEHQTLLRLQHHSFVPRVLDYLKLWEHEYLVIEHVDGRTVAQWLAREHPLLRHQPSTADRLRFAREMLDVLDETERCLVAMHAEGLTFGDLHHHNIMVRPDGRVMLIDFELSSTVDDEFPAALGALGFVDRSVVDAVNADWFAMGCCRLEALVPLNPLRMQNPDVLGQLLHQARQLYPMPAEVFDRMLDQLRRSPDVAARLTGLDDVSSPPRAPSVSALAAGIANATTPGRTDRLCPADIAVNRPGGALGLAYGASGVVLALHSAGQPVTPAKVEWLTSACRDAPDEVPPGLYDGLAGAAMALHRLGHLDQVLPLVTVLHDRLPTTDLTLFSGLTGIAHLLLDLGDLDAATSIAESVAARLDQPSAVPRPGLMHGWSGPAVLFARCAGETGDDRWLLAGEQAIEHDLRWVRKGERGELNLLSDDKLLPYLAGGSAGLALAMLAIPQDARPPGVLPFALGVARASAAWLVIQGGLFNGRAGLIYFLAQLARERPDWAGHVHEQRLLLGMHTVRRDGDEVLVGDQLLRLSTDLATGSAGALLALTAAVDNSAPALLPGAGVPLKPVPNGAKPETRQPRR